MAPADARPRTALAAIWREVLGVERGRHRRQLLRPRRPLAPAGAGARAAPLRARPGPVARGAVPAPDGSHAGRAPLAARRSTRVSHERARARRGGPAGADRHHRDGRPLPRRRERGAVLGATCGTASSRSRSSATRSCAAAGVDPALLRNPRYVRARGVLEGVELFDAGFFGLSPREAEIIDPQHRVFLEMRLGGARERRLRARRRCAGASASSPASGMNTYLLANLLTNPRADRWPPAPTRRCSATTRTSSPRASPTSSNLDGPEPHRPDRLLDVARRGPAGLPGLLTGECDMALAGGVSLDVPAGSRATSTRRADPLARRPLPRLRRARRRARCPARASASSCSSGSRDALADGDHVHAVIRGAAVNNDGSQKVGYTAPERRRAGRGDRRGPRAGGRRSRDDQLRRGARHRHAARRSRSRSRR